ncbi:MAG: outer membrane beta-barrel protein, partial [Amphritea sp.]|nr:outer membrane beta-barrel protein [Amphritea sp.]
MTKCLIADYAYNPLQPRHHLSTQSNGRHSLMKKPLKICAAALIFSTSCSTYAYDWSGAYAGGSLGYAQADDTAIAYDDGDTTPNDWTADVSLNGSALGVFGGYNWVRDNGVLFGIEAEYQHRMSHDGRAFEKKGGVTDTLFALNTEITAVASLKAR